MVVVVVIVVVVVVVVVAVYRISNAHSVMCGKQGTDIDTKSMEFEEIYQKFLEIVQLGEKQLQCYSEKKRNMVEFEEEGHEESDVQYGLEVITAIEDLTLRVLKNPLQV